MWLYGIIPWILPFFKFSRNILCYLHITTVKIKVMYCFLIYGYSMYLLRWYTILDFTAFYCCYLTVFYRDFYGLFLQCRSVQYQHIITFLDVLHDAAAQDRSEQPRKTLLVMLRSCGQTPQTAGSIRIHFVFFFA